MLSQAASQRFPSLAGTQGTPLRTNYPRGPLLVRIVESRKVLHDIFLRLDQNPLRSDLLGHYSFRTQTTALDSQASFNALTWLLRADGGADVALRAARLELPALVCDIIDSRPAADPLLSARVPGTP